MTQDDFNDVIAWASRLPSDVKERMQRSWYDHRRATLSNGPKADDPTSYVTVADAFLELFGDMYETRPQG